MRGEPVLGEQLAVRLDPVPDALGVVEPVDAEQEELWVAELVADLPGAFLDLVRAGELVERVRVDRDGEGGRAHVPVHPPVLVGERDDLAARRQVGEPPDDAHEVRGVPVALEAHEVRPEQTLDHLLAPRQLGEDLQRGERDVVEVADPHVRAQLAQHPRYQLQLVVVHPDGGAVRCLVGGRLGEPSVDPLVGVPPLPVERGRRDDVVVERPQGVVREALVELLQVVLAERDRDELGAVHVERVELEIGGTTPAHPRARGAGHHGRERRHQAPRRAGPGRFAGVVERDVDGKPVGDDDEVVAGHVGHLINSSGIALDPIGAAPIPPVVPAHDRTPGDRSPGVRSGIVSGWRW